MIKISDYLKEELIKVNLKTTEKYEVIKELARVMQNAQEITNYEKFLNDVFEREKLATTGIGNEIAIPHARTEVVTKFIMAIGISEKGIEFKSPDAKPAKLIFLMGIPKDEVPQYLKILACLTKLLKKEAFRKELSQAENARQIIETFRKFEK